MDAERASCIQVLSAWEEIIALLGETPLVSCNWRLTRACSARCGYCYSSSAQPLPNELDEGECLRVVDELAALGLVRLFISGGEPTLSKHLCRVVDRAASAGIKVGISTHGGHLSDRLIKSLRDAGLRQLQVSLDADGELHDEIRGVPGLWARALNSISLAAKEFPLDRDLIVATVVSRRNEGRILSLAEMVLAAGARSFVLVPLTVTGRASQDLQVPIERLIALSQMLERHFFGQSLRVSSLLPPAIATSGLGDRLSKAYLRPFPFEFAIDADGNCALADLDLNNCGHLLGNVRSRSLKEIYAAAVESELPFLLTDRNQVDGVCRVCAFWDVCGGGNRPLSRLQTGRKDASDVLCQGAFDAGVFPRDSIVGVGML